MVIQGKATLIGNVKFELATLTQRPRFAQHDERPTCMSANGQITTDTIVLQILKASTVTK